MTTQLAVTLDLWLTLVAELDGTQRSDRRNILRSRLTGEVLKRHGLSASESDLGEANTEIARLVTHDHDLGVDLEFQDRVAQLLALVDPELPTRLGEPGLADVANAIDEAFLESPPSFLPGAKDVLAQLDKMDLRVALISNTGLTSAAAYREWFSREGVIDLFDELTFSNEIACAKPNPDIFHPTLEKVGSTPELSLHIGDNLLTDISGAAGIGMKTGWISGNDDRDPMVQPDYTLNSISQLPGIVNRWISATGTGDS